MSTFEVTPSDLQSLASQLSGLLGELDAAAAGIDSDAAGSAQNAKLESSIQTFLSDWSIGLKQLQSKLAEFAQRLESAGSSYERTETDILSHLQID